VRFICLDSNNKVVSTRIGVEKVESEVQSDIGECGQIRQDNGTFITPETPAPMPNPLEKRISNLETLLLQIQGVI